MNETAAPPWAGCTPDCGWGWHARTPCAPYFFTHVPAAHLPVQSAVLHPPARCPSYLGQNSTPSPSHLLPRGGAECAFTYLIYTFNILMPTVSIAALIYSYLKTDCVRGLQSGACPLLPPFALGQNRCAFAIACGFSQSFPRAIPTTRAAPSQFRPRKQAAIVGDSRTFSSFGSVGWGGGGGGWRGVARVDTHTLPYRAQSRTSRCISRLLVTFLRKRNYFCDYMEAAGLRNLDCVLAPAGYAQRP